ALETFEQVLEKVQGLSDRHARLGEAGTLNQIAYAYYHLGEYEKALTAYQNALNIYTQEQSWQEQGAILTNIGVLYGDIGQYQKAIESHQQALTLAEQVNDIRKQGEVYNNMGTIYQKLNKNQEALQFYQKAFRILSQFDAIGWQGTILNNIGLIQTELEDYKKAIISYQEALALAEKDGDRVAQGRILNNLGIVYSKLGDRQQALQFLEDALVIRQELKDLPGERTTHNDIGTVYRELGEYETALTHYQKALKIAHQIQSRPQAGETLSNLGFTLLKSGQEATATDYLFQAVSIWESLHPGLDDDNKVSLMESQADTYRWLQQALIAQDKIEAALEVSERGRARAFAHLLSSRFNQSDLSLPPLTFEQIQQIARKQNATIVEYSIVIESELLYIWVIQPNGELEFRSVDIRSLRRNLSQLPPHQKIEKNSIQAGNFKNSNPGNLHQINYTTDTKKKNTVRRRDSSLYKQYQFLIEPIADLLPKNPDDHVIFIPHQELFLIPFAALQDEQGIYLIEKHTILISPSIQVLYLTYKHQKSLTENDELDTVVIGNPKMPIIVSELGGKPKPLSSLPGTEREALTIAKMLKTEPMIGDLATEDEAIKKMPKAHIIHMATHGLLNELKHLGLEIPGALALAPTSKGDGLLTASEILDLKLKAELVVLSACNTGRGKITEDGVIGLSRSFISAGVPSVIVSLWYIPDNPSADLMIEFYHQMQSQSDKAYALRQAMIKTMKNHPRPLDWAGFILMGQSGLTSS
ncbi:MAG: CHAT domain-containing tetratricopeptide repeat protein, partial [Cyanobacteriota bacterium]|nr:CHAT domain-containing tetratricopeptide repeat protein [Cyanobacteriota bacterium]